MAAVMTVGIVPTGTVTYRFRTGDCTTGSTVFRHTVTLTGTGRVPHSRPTGRLAGGDYSFQATYHGGAHIGTATSDCEKFTVRRADATVATTVFNHATGQPWLGEEGIGSRAFDTADVTGVVEGFTPTGSVTYHLFANPYCSGRAVSTETVDLKPDGSVPGSAPTRPLRPGQYSFLAAYNGDRNYTADTAGCEIFVVMPPEVPEVIPPPAEPGTPPPPPGEPALAPPVADLVLSKRVDRSIARQGQPLRYTLTVTNHGPDTATNVRLTDTPRLPLLTISIHPGQGHCRIGPPLTCELGTLRPGARVTVTITAVPILVGKRGNKAVVMNNTGVVMSDIHDPKPSNNVAGSVTAIRSAPAPAPPPFTG
jgi:uncharacterized repeat protein (TIGR01451 family)